MKTLSTIATLGVAGAVLAGCAGAGPSGMNMSMAGDGARVWRSTCAGCHNARPASEFDARAWPVIVSHMRTHADLTRADAEAIAEFLSSTAADAAATDADH